MVLKKIVRAAFNLARRLEIWSSGGTQARVYALQGEAKTSPLRQVHSVWDNLQFKENTQAFHLSGVVGFEEWVDMGEIRRRIKEIFGAEYKNERSLYPYLKTLSDIGLVESTDVGGKRQWRKKDILVKIAPVEEKSPEGQPVKSRERKKEGR
jgi:hypothetical protein